jgi:hypothetical protein
MITTPTGPTFMQNDGQSGARSGDHTQFGVVPAMSPQVFHNVERAARKKLAGRRSFAELASQRR